MSLSHIRIRAATSARQDNRTTSRGAVLTAAPACVNHLCALAKSSPSSQLTCRAEGDAVRSEGTSPTPSLNGDRVDVIDGQEGRQESRDDDVRRIVQALPDSLGDALQQAGEATQAAIDRGGTRCLVEILLPEFWDPVSGAVFAEEGDQQRFWKLTRKFIDSLDRCEPGRNIRLVYPDSGVTALLRNSWQDLPYLMSSLTDRTPVDDDDELIVIAAPDPQGLEMCKKIAAELEDLRPLVLFNPRLASGDVGVGLNVRRMRSRFLSTFTTTYSLRPFQNVGSVFRRYPGMWQVFLEDAELPGRYKLVAEKPSRPAGEALDDIIMSALGQQRASAEEASNKPSFLRQLRSTVTSLQKFAKQLSQ